MAQTTAIAAMTRTVQGSRASRKLRAAGKIPAILYGHKETPVNLVLDETELRTALRQGLHGMIQVAVDGKAESVVIKDLQYDHLGTEIFHVDFERVSADERVTARVPIHLKGTPVGLKGGGILDQPIHEIEIECAASKLVEHILVNITDLHLGQAITVADLPLPEGAKALGDVEGIVVHVIKPATASDEPALPGEVSATEPELIRREKPAEDAEE
ncbi:50S ribosomal protein L25 [bacterium]|jgi:large subunit ribosomal protein L25|nr:50S ribosomal protein L25 [bacterium]